MFKQQYYTYNAWIAIKDRSRKGPQELLTPAEMAEAMCEKERRFILSTAHQILADFKNGESILLHTPAGKRDEEQYPKRILEGIASELFKAGWLVHFEWLSRWDYRSWNFGIAGGRQSYEVHIAPRN
jgi:hypothetical protein